MKVTTLLLFFATIAVISAFPGFSDKVCTQFTGESEENQAFSKDFCRSLGITTSWDKCCYVKYKNENGYFYNCVQITMEQFYNIKEYKKELADTKNAEIKSIECDSSSYLYGSLLLLLVFLF